METHTLKLSRVAPQTLRLQTLSRQPHKSVCSVPELVRLTPSWPGGPLSALASVKRSLRGTSWHPCQQG